MNAYVPDNGYRRREPRYGGQAQQRSKPAPLYNKAPQPQPLRVVRAQDFRGAADHSPWVCPAGARRYRNGHHRDLRGLVALKFTGRKTACGSCAIREQGLRSPATTLVRQVAGRLAPPVGKPETPTARRKCKLDSPLGREMITRRFATVEPVFGNLRHNKRLDRFTLRGCSKVDGQWKLYGVVHNMEKLAPLGYAR